jgi:hypothetical protein
MAKNKDWLMKYLDVDDLGRIIFINKESRTIKFTQNSLDKKGDLIPLRKSTLETVGPVTDCDDDRPGLLVAPCGITIEKEEAKAIKTPKTFLKKKSKKKTKAKYVKVKTKKKKKVKK